MLTDRYLGGIPEGSRASRPSSLSPDLLGAETIAKIGALNDIARRRGQALAQMALAWVLRDARVTSALIGASSVEQLETNVAALSIANGSDPTPIAATIAAADALIGGNTIPMKVSPSSLLGQQMTALAATLDAYNNGLLCAPHRK